MNDYLCTLKQIQLQQKEKTDFICTKSLYTVQFEAISLTLNLHLVSKIKQINNY